MRSRREITGSRARDTLQRSPAHVPTASLEAPASRARSSNGAAGHGTAPRDGSSAASPRPVPLAGRRSLQNGIKNWRVRSRLLLLVVLPTLSAVILGGFAVTASVRSAAAYQRVFAPLTKKRNADLARVFAKDLTVMQALVSVPTLQDLDQVRLRDASESLVNDLAMVGKEAGLEKPRLGN